MSDSVFFVLELEVKPGQIDNLRTVMREMVELTRLEPGTLNYEWFLRTMALVAISTNATPIREQSWRTEQRFQ